MSKTKAGNPPAARASHLRKMIATAKRKGNWERVEKLEAQRKRELAEARQRRASRKQAMKKWRNHEPMTAEEYRLVQAKGYFGGKQIKTVSGGLPSLGKRR